MPAEETIGYIYRTHWYLGPKLSTNGYGFEFNYEKRGTEQFRHSFHLSVNKVKTHNESKISNAYYEDSKPYVFGKLNQLYTAHLSYGGSWKLFEKKRLNGISIRFNQQIGLSYGFVKPIYVKIKEPFSQDITVQPETVRYNPLVHTEAYVFGRAPNKLGFSEGKSIFGMYLKSGIQFDFNPNKNTISAVEVGVQIDCFDKKVPLFYEGKNYSLFPALYACVLFGKNKI